MSLIFHSNIFWHQEVTNHNGQSYNLTSIYRIIEHSILNSLSSARLYVSYMVNLILKDNGSNNHT